MNHLGGTMPEHGMSREETGELVREAGIDVVRVDKLRDGTFAPYYHLPAPDLGGWSMNAKRFREHMRAGSSRGLHATRCKPLGRNGTKRPTLRRMATTMRTCSYASDWRADRRWCCSHSMP
jgi:hypothetical protein